MTTNTTFSGNDTGDHRGLGPGTRLGHYELREPIGRGGMGQVWKAFDEQGDRDVALKVLPAEFRGNSDAIAQVRDAFRVIHVLTHQHIGKTIGLFNDPEHGPFVVMDFLPGVSLSRYARSYRKQFGTMPLQHVVQLLRPVAEALDYAHSKSVLHRDVKPENILVEVKDKRVGDIWLIDFGLAAEIHQSMSRFTQGKIDTRGTRPYQSPEQLRGKKSLWDSRTDQYSLAVVAYELLAGHLPFEGDDFVLMNAILNEQPEPIASMNPTVNSALLKALDKQKEIRFRSCSDFVQALSASPSSVAERVGTAPPPSPVAPTEASEKPAATEVIHQTSTDTTDARSQTVGASTGKFGHLLKAAVVPGSPLWYGFEPYKNGQIELVLVRDKNWLVSELEVKRWTVPVTSIDSMAVHGLPYSVFGFTANRALQVLLFLPLLFLALPIVVLQHVFTGRSYSLEVQYRQRQGLIASKLRLFVAGLKLEECEAMLTFFRKHAAQAGNKLKMSD